MGALRNGVTWVFRRLVVPAYFRDVEVTGEVPARDVRGRLFVSNHVNAILDPILVFVTAGCDISPVAKSTLWKVPGLAFLLGVVDSVRIVRRTDEPGKQGGSNDQVFDEVATWLKDGGNILIFPEGTSHNEPHLVPLKSGAARMLQRAREIGPEETLTVQSIALEFDDREQARSRVLLRYGPVRRAGDFPADGDTVVASFNEAIRRDLSEQLVEAPTWDALRLLSRVAEMLANDAGDPSMSTWSRFGLQAKRVLAGAPLLALREAVNAYHARLAEIGLTDADIACPPPPFFATLPRRLALFVTLPLAVTGLLLQGPPYLATRIFAGRVKSGDETSTIRLGIALALHPPWTALLLGLLFWRLPFPWSLLAATVVILSPVATIAWIDATPRLLRALRKRLHGARLPALREARRAAMIVVHDTISGTPKTPWPPVSSVSPW